MLLGALERLVLFVRPLLLMVSVASLGARPHRLLLAAQPPHPSTHLVPGGGGSTTPRGSAGPPCRRAGVPLILKSTLNSVSCTWRHSSHTSHQTTSEASADHVAVTRH